MKTVIRAILWAFRAAYSFALGLLGFFAIIALAYFLFSRSGPSGAESTETGPAPRVLSGVAIVPLAEDAISIRNEGPLDWPELQVFINNTFPAGLGYSLTIPALKKGQAVRYGLRQFTKDNGERFDPSRYELKNVSIGGNGYKYEDFKP
jgi:hypothetical protein